MRRFLNILLKMETGLPPRLTEFILSFRGGNVKNITKYYIIFKI